jgi:hypothetical protein
MGADRRFDLLRRRDGFIFIVELAGGNKTGRQTGILLD